MLTTGIVLKEYISMFQHLLFIHKNLFSDSMKTQIELNLPKLKANANFKGILIRIIRNLTSTILFNF